MKRIISLLLVLMMAVSLFPAVHAGSAPAVSSNIDEHFYINVQRWNDPIRSTLAYEDGGYLRVECIGDRLVVERYDASFRFLSGQEIPLELPVYGGVYICDDYNFVMVGQTNYEEDDTKEVFRIIRYTKDWQKVDHASIYGANTTVPFDGGSCRFDRSGDMLYVRTCHEMYTSSDGNNHQANVMIAVRISDMTVTDQFTSVLNQNYGYVSHSFNQFVRVDGDTLLAVDHGDYYPRSVALFRYSQPAGSETFYGRTTMVNALPIVDSTYHYNDTGVSVGGFEFSSTDYLIAGCSYDQTASTDLRYAHRNIFVTATPKDDFTDKGTTVHWLTDFTADDGVTVSPPHLLKLDADRFFLTWTEDGQMKYCFLNGHGELDGEIYSGDGNLSDCQPILAGNRIIWYVTDNSAPVFHEIDLDSPAFDPDVLGYGKAGDDIEWVLYDDYTLTFTGSGEMYDFTSSTEPWKGWTGQITRAVIGEGITSIGNYTFYSCHNLTSVSLPSTLVRAGINAFAYCDKLDTVVFPAGMQELGRAIFFRCKALTSVELPDSITTIGRAAFDECVSLKDIDLPAGLTVIEQELFHNCTALETVIIPRGVTSIADYAFSGCAALTTLSIPDTVTSIGKSFHECGSLERFTLNAANPAYCTDSQGALYTIDMSTLINIPGGYPGSFTIPNTVTTVQEHAGSGCIRMTSLVIPNSVTHLGDYAFSDSTALTDVSIPSSITTLPASCFSCCSSLSSVVIPDSVTVMKDHVFFLCTSLTQVDMPARLEQFGNVFPSCSALTSIVIPEGVTELEPSTFSSCSALETVTLPSTLTAIGQHCFTECTNLRQINLPEGLTTIGPGAFIRCKSLAELTLPSTLKLLSSLAFYDSGLSTVTFTGPAPTFESTSVFEQVTATVYYPMGDESWTEEVRQQYRGNLTWIAKDMHVHNWTAATCTAPKTCTVCGATEGEPLGHQVVADPGYPATCTQGGLTDGSHCGRCGLIFTAQQAIPALNHDYQAVVTAPTCTEYGYTAYTCSRCGDSYTDDRTAPLGHSYGSWTVTQAPTCTVPGIESRSCEYCGRSEQRTLEALGHDYETVITEPSCTEQGFTTHTCILCGNSYIDAYTSALGHQWDDGVVITEPTEEEPGLRRHTCLRCSSTEERAIPALGHTHAYALAVTLPTCTKQGYTTHTCACGDSYVDTYTAALGHAEVTDAGYAATCTEPGLTDGAHCDRCDLVLRQQEVIPAAGHRYGSVVTAPTCTAQGFTTHTCACGDSYIDSNTAVLGHDWKDLACTRCGALRENPFTDTEPGSFYFDPVLWALEKGITTGATPTTFDPMGQCQRAQVVTFLWRAAGSPEPTSDTNPFVDVTEADFFYKAVLWAVEKGVTNGLDDTHFGPYTYCNRAQVVTFLWRARKEPEPTSAVNPFADVKAGDFYYDAVLWAVEQGVTNGLSAGEFGVDSICNRAQIVTFLYRTFA